MVELDVSLPPSSAPSSSKAKDSFNPRRGAFYSMQRVAVARFLPLRRPAVEIKDMNAFFDLRPMTIPLQRCGIQLPVHPEDILDVVLVISARGREGSQNPRDLWLDPPSE